MDVLNQATGQLRELMLSMTPAARVTALLLLGVIGVSLGYLAQHQTAGSDDFLFNGEFLPGSVVDRAEAAIAQAGLTGYERVGNRIKVPRARKPEFMAAVADGGALPANFHQIVEKALDVSPFASGDTRREKLRAARARQLSMLVSRMAGIEHADVMVDIIKATGLSRKGIATASVSVRPAAGETLDARQVKMIQKAVAGGVAELKPGDVVVTNTGDGSSFGGGSEVSMDSFENEYYRTKLAFEENMQGKIMSLLREVPGVRVQVIAELETALERTSQTMTPEGEAVAIREETQNETDKVSEIDNGGRPGATAQGPLRNKNESPSVTVRNEHTKDSVQSEFLAGQKSEFLREAALVPKNVRASITVPTNYLLSVWRERERMQGNDPDQPLPDDIGTRLENLKGPVKDDITNAVVTLLPKELAKNNLSNVEVVYFDSLTPEVVEGPSTATQALGWASKNFNTMTMAVVALVSLLMLRSMVKSIPAAEPAAALSGATLALDTVEGSPGQSPAGGGEAGDGEEGSNRPRLKLKKGDSLKDDLVEIVREDPDAAAAILRSWIGNAG